MSLAEQIPEDVANRCADRGYLAAALRYASQRRPVFPCKPCGKAPMTRRGLLDATSDPGTITEWWGRWPDANVAIRTGRESRLVVIDVDGDAGAESLHDLERMHGQFPPTASVATPRGGAHFYFRHPNVEVRNSAGALGTGIDVRGDGGYVLAPPSCGTNERLYEPDACLPVAGMPPWLRERLAARQTATPRASVSEWLSIVREGLPEGERNHGLARLVGHLLSRDVDARLVRELAQLVNGRFRPPMQADEVDRVVESIAGRELRRRAGGQR